MSKRTSTRQSALLQAQRPPAAVPQSTIAFVESDTDDIPDGGNLPMVVVSYTLDLSPDTTGLHPVLIPGQGITRPNEDGPLDIRVPKKNCRFVIKLADNGLDWEFDKPAIKLGKQASSSGDPPRTRYFKLVPDSKKRVSFGARYASQGPKDNTDPFVILVKITEPDGTLCWLKIDPDIKNPGDKVVIPPPARTSRR